MQPAAACLDNMGAWQWPELGFERCQGLKTAMTGVYIDDNQAVARPDAEIAVGVLVEPLAYRADVSSREILPSLASRVFANVAAGRTASAGADARPLMPWQRCISKPHSAA